MRATTVRFSEDLWNLLEGESKSQGVSAAQFVRDATIMRISYLMGRRGDPDVEATLQRIAGGGNGDDGAVDRAAIAKAVSEAKAAAGDPERLRSLAETGLLDSPAEERFDRQARLAAEVLNAPVALVSVIDDDRQFFKSCLGLPEPWASARETPLSHSFCQHAVVSREPLIVDDAREHPVLRDNAAIRDLGVIAYAGVPLIDSRDQALGTLCVIDSHPRQWSSHQVSLLRDLAASVVTEVELGRAAEAKKRGGQRG